MVENTDELIMKVINDVKSRDPKAYDVIYPIYLEFKEKKKRMGKEAYKFFTTVRL
jgi:hypothetical protein